MRKFNAVLILTMIIAVSGCTATSTPEKRSLDSPSLTRSEFFATKDARMVFKIVRGQMVSRYEMFLGVRKKFNKVVFMKIEFENPLNKQKPIVRYRKLYPNERKLFLKSPPIPGRESYANYEVVLTLYNDKNLKVKLGEHRQIIRSLLEAAI